MSRAELVNSGGPGLAGRPSVRDGAAQLSYDERVVLRVSSGAHLVFVWVMLNTSSLWCCKNNHEVLIMRDVRFDRWES